MYGLWSLAGVLGTTLWHGLANRSPPMVSPMPAATHLLLHTQRWFELQQAAVDAVESKA